jgi:transcription elongation factor Elf1
MNEKMVSCPKCGGTKFNLFKVKKDDKVVEVRPQCVICTMAKEVEEAKVKANE